MNVPLDPMQDVDATYDFLVEYTEALVLAAYQEIVDVQNLQLDNVLEIERSDVVRKLLEEMTDKFAFPSMIKESDLQNDHLTCQHCGKKYKSVNTLRRHQAFKHLLSTSLVEEEVPVAIACKFCYKIYQKNSTYKNHLQEKHGLQEIGDDIMVCPKDLRTVGEGVTCKDCGKKYKRDINLQKHVQKMHSHDNSANDSQDYVHNKEVSTSPDHVVRYSCTALFLGLLTMNFVDAIRHADGDRVLRMYKYFLLLFRQDGRTKYAYHSVHLLLQCL